MRGKEGGLEFLPGTVSSGFRRKLHQTVLPISRIGPTILFGNTRQQCVMNSFALLHTCMEVFVHMVPCTFTCLFVARHPCHFVKTPFSGFRIALVRLFGTPETSKLHSLVFHYFSLCSSSSTEKSASQESSSITRYG